MKNPHTGESLIDYPTYFTYKIIGENREDFASLILGIVEQVVPPIKEEDIKISYSKNKKFMTLTIKAYVTNHDEVHGIYDELKKEKRVLWAI